jgi:hypothetical protein
MHGYFSPDATFLGSPMNAYADEFIFVRFFFMADSFCVSLEFALFVVVNVLCSCLYLFGAIVELHVMGGTQCSITFSHWKVKVGLR